MKPNRIIRGSQYNKEVEIIIHRKTSKESKSECGDTKKKGNSQK